MRFFSNPMFSLFCSGFNTFFAVGAFTQGSIALGIVCTIFAGICFRNYLKHR